MIYWNIEKCTYDSGIIKAAVYPIVLNWLLGKLLDNKCGMEYFEIHLLFSITKNRNYSEDMRPNAEFHLFPSVG